MTDHLSAPSVSSSASSSLKLFFFFYFCCFFKTSSSSSSFAAYLTLEEKPLLPNKFETQSSSAGNPNLILLSIDRAEEVTAISYVLEESDDSSLSISGPAGSNDIPCRDGFRQRHFATRPKRPKVISISSPNPRAILFGSRVGPQAHARISLLLPAAATNAGAAAEGGFYEQQQQRSTNQRRSLELSSNADFLVNGREIKSKRNFEKWLFLKTLLQLHQQ